jgi:hypothetical protein
MGFAYHRTSFLLEFLHSAGTVCCVIPALLPTSHVSYQNTITSSFRVLQARRTPIGQCNQRNLPPALDLQDSIQAPHLEGCLASVTMSLSYQLSCSHSLSHSLSTNHDTARSHWLSNALGILSLHICMYVCA